MTAPLVTVALCTHNHLDRLQVTLEHVKRLRCAGASWELLIVDNGSTDGTHRYLARADWRPAAAAVRIVEEPRLGIAPARNRAVTESRGAYVLFIDDDETPDPRWLDAYVEAIDTWHPDVLGGRIRVEFVDGPRPAWLRDELLGFLGALDHGATGRWLDSDATPLFTGNAAFRRDLFARIGMFDERLGRRGAANFGGEDIEMYERAIARGGRVRWVPDAIIDHRVSAPKVRRGYFLGLHYRYGQSEGARRRREEGRYPPAYVIGQLARAMRTAAGERLVRGSVCSLRKEMNAAYFVGLLHGWIAAGARNATSAMPTGSRHPS